MMRLGPGLHQLTAGRLTKAMLHTRSRLVYAYQSYDALCGACYLLASGTTTAVTAYKTFRTPIAEVVLTPEAVASLTRLAETRRSLPD